MGSVVYDATLLENFFEMAAIASFSFGYIIGNSIGIFNFLVGDND